jgi:hypothetical protein
MKYFRFKNQLVQMILKKLIKKYINSYLKPYKYKTINIKDGFEIASR